MKAKEKLDPETEALIAEWAKNSSLDYRQAKILWYNLRVAMLIQLGANLKSIDLGFCVIHPRPFRENWKNYVLQRFEHFGQWIRGKNKAEKERIIREAGFREELHRSVILAVRNGLMYIGLEIVPRFEWWSFMLSAQHRMASLLGPAGYCKAMGGYVHKVKDKFVEAYLSHLHQIAIPCGGLSNSRYYGGAQTLTEYRERKKVTPSTAAVRLFPPYHSNRPDEFQPPDDQAVQGEKAARMLPMPDIQPEVIDVRDSAEKPPAPGGGD